VIPDFYNTYKRPPTYGTTRFKAVAQSYRDIFVHPEWARHGIGRGILAACESALQAAGFHSAELVATLAGEPFYAAFNYSSAERYEIPVSAELTLPVVHMTKHFGVG